MQLTVSPLPALSEEDELLCLFGNSPAHAARVEGDVVICNSPHTIPRTPAGQGEASTQQGGWGSRGAGTRLAAHPPGACLMPSLSAVCRPRGREHPAALQTQQHLPHVPPVPILRLSGGHEPGREPAVSVPAGLGCPLPSPRRGRHPSLPSPPGASPAQATAGPASGTCATTSVGRPPPTPRTASSAPTW